MSRAVYLDSDVLLATYTPDPRSPLAQERLDESSSLFTSSLTYAEVHAVLGRYVRQGGLSNAQYGEARDRFEGLWASMSIIPFEAVLPQISRICQEHTLKGADAIHLCTALAVAELMPSVPLELLTFDGRLGRAALVQGLSVWPPR